MVWEVSLMMRFVSRLLCVLETELNDAILKGNKPQRGFYYVQGGKEMFVPRKQIVRFFREWDFTHV